MYKCKPERNVAQMILLIAGAALVTGGIFVLAAFWKENAGLIRFIGFFSLAVSIYFLYRFTLTEVEYTLYNGEFTVTRIVGSKRTELAVLDLADTVALVTKSEFKAQGLNKGLSTICNYSQNFGNDHWVYVFTFQDKKASVEFEPNDAFVAIFRSEIERAKNRPSDSDGDGVLI